MFDFGNANDEQRQVISVSEGPVLIIAGPGTGKSYTLVQRTIYLIEECKVKPESIFIVTFTEKAAKELITRITNELVKHNIAANINEMYIGTFHSICLRILKEHIEYTRLKRNYRMLDSFDQQYTVFQNISKFDNIPDIKTILPENSKWKRSAKICEYVNNLSEELVNHNELKKDSDPEISVLGNILEVYYEMLNENNLMDFSSIQTETYRLLNENSVVLEEIRSKISHIMVDEYQDTNYIQEQIIFLIGGIHKNICVVGDDDQGLYRFRGATIRNILEFPHKFDKDECKIIKLETNYRSDSDIISFYNEWMSDSCTENSGFNWENFRYDKKIKPHKKSEINSPAVVKLTSDNDEDKWHEKILNFITELKSSGKIKNYNQIAFLFKSVKDDRIIDLAHYLEKNGINVYSPRSNMFFEREEIRLVIGCLMIMFPLYVRKLEEEEKEREREKEKEKEKEEEDEKKESNSYLYLKPKHIKYYKDCIAAANSYLKMPENSKFSEWINQYGIVHTELEDTTDYAYSGLIYKLFEFEPFVSILDTEISAGVTDIRPARNLAKFTQLIGKFEYLYKIDVLNAKYINIDTEILFNLYLRVLFDGGISEYEDDSEYAPSGCVSFLTIHQSKGMEFPIVFVDSLGSSPRKSFTDLMVKIEDKYFKRSAFEPYDTIKYFDFWRLYYTAFSRAQDLLILTCNEKKGRGRNTPSRHFKKILEKLQSVESDSFDLSEFKFNSVKNVNIKNTFSFTSHITVYETCSRQYKFYKELEFMPVREGAILFGVLVHQTIEDIHRAVLRKEENTVTTENITEWFNSNYSALTKAEHSYLGKRQQEAALKQILKYVERQKNNWNTIKQAEVDVSLVKPDYIIEGKIDLIKGEKDTVEIIDFKSEKKPDIAKMKERLNQYRRQLYIYSYLVEERTGQKVSNMHLYYTGDESDNPTVTFPYEKADVEETMAVFDNTVRKIMSKDFNKCANDSKICTNCDFQYYCKNIK